jgi:tetratricopeptide (TPR) repeat protein
LADERTDDLTDEEDLTLEPQQAGLAFKAEMWAMDTLLGYWPYLLGAIAVVLGCVFFYGQYTNYVTTQQRASAKAIAKIEAKLPDRVSSLAIRGMTGQDPVSPEDLVASAQKLEAVEASGPARAEAMLKAAELYRIAEKPGDQRRVLEAAIGAADGVLAFTAESAVANLDLEAGDNDAAVTRLRRLTTEYDGYLAEQALLDLGLVLEQLGKPEEARAVYDDFLTRFAESPRAEEAENRKAGLGAG